MTEINVEENAQRFAEAERQAAQAAYIARLEAENAALKNTPVSQTGTHVAQETPALLGGAPVLHHLHLADGRVITNHEGIGTHYSDENGVTRVVSHFPANEPDPASKNAL